MNSKISLFSISLLLLMLVPLAAYAGPKVYMPRTLIKLEKPVFQGVPIEGVFEVDNNGDSPLIIQKVKPG